MATKDVTYYSASYDGLTDLGNYLKRANFESMDEAIAHLENAFPKFMQYHEHFKVLHEYTNKWELGYTHQIVLIDEKGYCSIVYLRVDKKHLYLE